MLLKFVGYEVTPNPIDHVRPFEVGQEYEVAEIFEYPGHLMVRDPGEKDWPKPGDSTFAWHPEVFERTDDPIPIIACGYAYSNHLGDRYGALLDDPEDVSQAHQYDELTDTVISRHEEPWPDDEEDYDAWYSRVGNEYSEPLACATYELENTEIGVPAVFIRDNVFLAEEGFRVPFAAFSYSTQELVEHDVSNSEAQGYIDTLLRALSIRPRPARLLGFVGYWHKLEYPRLINPRSKVARSGV